MTREPGYYWVKLQPTDDEKHVAKWNGKYWTLSGETFAFSDDTLSEINESRILPECPYCGM